MWGAVNGHRMWYPLLVEGTPFGRYRLLDLLGAGAMGEVHRAYDTGTDRMVAVKVLAPEFAHDARYRKRFQREAQVAARLAEPHIVPIHDFGEIDGRLYLDMRLVQAPDLAKLLAERDRLEPGEAVEVIAQVAAALDAAHAQGLVHRDVKPSNILVTPKKFAYLIDFGIARSDEDTTVTTTGAVIGTFAYMAPERLADDESDARSDVYSLACVLYECLVGAKPYRGDSLQRQIAAHLNEEPPSPSTAGLPRLFDAVIAKGMAKDPADRYASAGELAAAARAALWEPPTKASPVPVESPASGVAAAAVGTDPDLPVDPRDLDGPGPDTPVDFRDLDVPGRGTPVTSPDSDTSPVSAEPPISGTAPDAHTPGTTPDPDTPAAVADPDSSSTAPDPSPVREPALLPDPISGPGPDSAPVPVPIPHPPWRAIIVLSVLAVAIAGTSALALTRDTSAHIPETPGVPGPVTSSVERQPDTSVRPSERPGPSSAHLPPVSITQSVPGPWVAPGGPVAEPEPPPGWTEPEPPPHEPPPPVTTTPSSVTTTPPPVTTTVEPTTTTVEPTESETTTPETTTSETTTPSTTATPTTGEEGEEVAGTPDATGSTIATSSTAEITDGASTTSNPVATSTTTAPSHAGTTGTPPTSSTSTATPHPAG